MIISFADKESKIKVYSGIGEVWIVPTKKF